DPAAAVALAEEDRLAARLVQIAAPASEPDLANVRDKHGIGRRIGARGQVGIDRLHVQVPAGRKRNQGGLLPGGFGRAGKKLGGGGRSGIWPAHAESDGHGGGDRSQREPESGNKCPAPDSRRALLSSGGMAETPCSKRVCCRARRLGLGRELAKKRELRHWC